MAETASNLHLKRFCETRMNMQVLPLTLWVNQKNLPAMLVYFLIALNWLFVIYFIIKMFITINYHNILHYIDININLYHQNRYGLNSIIHTLNGNLIKCGDHDTIVIISHSLLIFVLVKCCVNALFVLLCDNNIIFYKNTAQTIESRMIYLTITFANWHRIGKRSHYVPFVMTFQCLMCNLMIFGSNLKNVNRRSCSNNNAISTISNDIIKQIILS